MSRRIAIFLIVIVVLAIAGYEFAANFSYTRHVTLPPNMLAGSSTDAYASASASSTAPADILSTASPASSTIDTSSWRTYSDPQSRYSIRYPGNVSVNVNANGNLVLAFPKDQYFHWPLLDDAVVTVTASSSCPKVQGPPGVTAPTTLSVNGYEFTRIEGGDVAASNIYRELAYDTQGKNLCYHIDFLDHGANGATLYVGDQSLAAGYDATHAIDLSAVIGMFNAMVNTFRIGPNMI